METTFRGTLINSLHTRQKLKSLLFILIFLTLISALLIGQDDNASSFLIVGSFVLPILIYWLYRIITGLVPIKLSIATIEFQGRKTEFSEIQAITRKRAIFSSFSPGGRLGLRPIYFIVEVITVVCEGPDIQLGSLLETTSDVEHTYEREVLEDNSLLFTEIFPQFPVADILLLTARDMVRLKKILTNRLSKMITPISAGSA